MSDGDAGCTCRSQRNSAAERRRKSRSLLRRADVRALGEAVVDPLDPVLVRLVVAPVAVLVGARHALEVRRVVLDEEAVGVDADVVHDELGPALLLDVGEGAAEERVDLAGVRERREERDAGRPFPGPFWDVKALKNPPPTPGLNSSLKKHT